MAFDFPSSPTEGQVFTDLSSGAQYRYQAPAWRQLSNSPPPPLSGTTSDTPPSSPAAGQLWWESDTGKMFIFYVDPSGPPGQWVQISGPLKPSGVEKISEGTLAANAPNVEVALPTSGYMSFELQGSGFHPTAAAAAAYSAALQFSIAGVWKTGASDYATHWDLIQSSGAASAGWQAGSNQALAYGFVAPYVYMDQGYTFFKLSMPCVSNSLMAPNYMVDSHGYAQGAWTRARSGGALTGNAGNPPDRIRLYFVSATVRAGFKWQLNGIR